MDVENLSQAENVVLTRYMEYMQKYDDIPTSRKIFDATKYFMEVNCYDILYPEINKSVDMTMIEQILLKYKYVFKIGSQLVNEAQNILFDNWFEFQKILLEG